MTRTADNYVLDLTASRRGYAINRLCASLTDEDSAERALQIGLVTELVPHERLLARATELAAAIAEVPAPTMRALKNIYGSGAAGTVDAALAAEREAASRQRPDLANLEARRAAVTDRNRRQVRP
jgi:enoyl-CoA hydratase